MRNRIEKFIEDLVERILEGIVLGDRGFLFIFFAIFALIVICFSFFLMSLGIVLLKI